MVKGIASKELVVGKAGLMGYFGTGGPKLPKIDEVIQFIQRELKDGQTYGIKAHFNVRRNRIDSQSAHQNTIIVKNGGQQNNKARPTLAWIRCAQMA